MKVLVMNCSPVRNGATAEIVNIVTARLEKKKYYFSCYIRGTYSWICTMRIKI